MEAELYRKLYQLVMATPHPKRKRVQYSDKSITLVYFWGVLHDRPVSWACQERNWPPRWREDFGQLPSDSAMSARLRTVGVMQLVERLMSAASDLVPPAPGQEPGHVPLVKQIDSKPMVVGAYSKDPDARRGRLADGQFAKGYRLHALTHGRVVRHFTLLPLNVHDSLAAPVLLPALEGGGYVLGDNAYDTNDCHALAAAANHQLVSPARACNKGVRDIKFNCPQRLRALDMLDSPLEKCGHVPPFGQNLYNGRQRIESAFGGMSFLGIGYPPAWVRGARRVALWAATKIIVYLIRNAKIKQLR
jgi:hypothetical protein